MWISLLCRVVMLLVPVLIVTGRPLLAADDAKQAEKVRSLLERRCFECHGKNTRDIKADLAILNYSALTDKGRQIVVSKSPQESVLLERVVESDDELRMPPAPHLRLTEDEASLLRSWIAAGAPKFVSAESDAAAPAVETPTQLVASVKEIFRSHCLSCHDAQRPAAGVRILNRESLIQRHKLTPGNSDRSRIFQLISAENAARRMPPEGKRPLSYTQIEQVRKWIAIGAPEFPPDVAVDVTERKIDVGLDAVLKRIIAHQQSLPEDQRPHWRYFSANHLAAAGATREQLDLQHDALAKAINHLSRESEIVPVTIIDTPLSSLFAVDIRRLGWNKQPYRVVDETEAGTESNLTIYDLALLEYPYAYAPLDSPAFDVLAKEFIQPAGLVRPIPFLRVDWFVSVVTQPPLYEDFLQLPFDVQELEEQLGVTVPENVQNQTAIRAGMTVSGVSKNNRVVEHHPSREGSYWKSIDFSASKGVQNMFLDPVNLKGAGGEFVFTLPNGLHGYYIANAAGRRLDDAPTEIVTDKFAEDKVVRNGLACMRCHDEGVKPFTDSVRPALERLPGRLPFDKVTALKLYRPVEEMDQKLQTVRDRFLAALEKATGRPQAIEPLTPVSHRFLDEDIPLSMAAGELGLTDATSLEAVFRLPQFASLGLVSLGAPGGSIRRDTWEDYFPSVVRDLGLGEPIVPLDGVTRDDFPPTTPPFDVDITTNKANNLFEIGDGAIVLLRNQSSQPLFARLIFTGTRGEKITPEAATFTIAPGETGRFPQSGELKVQPSLGKEKIAVLVSDEQLPPVVTLRGRNLTDRVLHPFFRLTDQDGTPRTEFDASRIVKRTLTIETR